MADHDCIHEGDVVAAVLGRRWDRANDDLKQHAAQCETCRDVVAVASVLSADQEHARYEVRVPAAGQVWWRAAVRARMEAARTAARPVAWAQGATAASLFGILCAATVLAWPFIQRVLGATAGRLSAGLDTSGLQALPVMVALERSLPLAVGVVAVVVIAPLLVLYFALAGDD